MHFKVIYDKLTIFIPCRTATSTQNGRKLAKKTNNNKSNKNKSRRHSTTLGLGASYLLQLLRTKINYQVNKVKNENGKENENEDKD